VKKHLKYLSYVLRHKWYVFIECCKLGIPWTGIIHDLSKFRPSEWFPYANYFYGNLEKGQDETTEDKEIDLAWLLHQKRNKHHWQWWILPEDEGGVKILPMADRYRKEMLADWKGAGKALGKPDCQEWYLANKNKMRLHPETRRWIEENI
jgi:hypothetical protein